METNRKKVKGKRDVDSCRKSTSNEKGSHSVFHSQQPEGMMREAVQDELQCKVSSPHAEQKTTKFSLSKIGRSSTFTFRKKVRGREKDIPTTWENMESCNNNMSSRTAKDPSTRLKDISKSPASTTAKVEHVVSPLSKCNEKSATSPARAKQPSLRVTYKADDDHVRRKTKENQRRKGGVKDRDRMNTPRWLEQPPVIHIEDFSSEYTDEETFYDEYFDLVEWALQVLMKQCYFEVQPKFKETNECPHVENSLKVMTNETARIGDALNYILHPISTGATNVMQTGAKFADFTARIWRGIHLESFVKGFSEDQK